MSKQAKSITSFVKSLTALVKAKHGDEGAVSGVTSAVSKLQEEYHEFKDPVFHEACNELATAAVSRVSVAGGDESEDPPSLASGMAHTGENAYRKVGKTDPSTGTTQKEQAGDANPEHDHTPKKPQPSIRGSTTHTGDMTAENSKPLV